MRFDDRGKLVSLLTIILFVCVFLSAIGFRGCPFLRATDVNGKVVDPDGAPIKGASVYMEGEPEEVGDVPDEALTDDNGQFHFIFTHHDGDILHNVYLSVKKDGYDNYERVMEIIESKPVIVLKKK